MSWSWPDPSKIFDMIKVAVQFGFSMQGFEAGLASVGLNVAESTLIAVAGPAVEQLPVANALVPLGIQVFARALNMGLVHSATGGAPTV